MCAFDLSDNSDGWKGQGIDTGSPSAVGVVGSLLQTQLFPSPAPNPTLRVPALPRSPPDRTPTLPAAGQGSCGLPGPCNSRTGLALLGDRGERVRCSESPARGGAGRGLEGPINARGCAKVAIGRHHELPARPGTLSHCIP